MTLTDETSWLRKRNDNKREQGARLANQKLFFAAPLGRAACSEQVTCRNLFCFVAPLNGIPPSYVIIAPFVDPICYFPVELFPLEKNQKPHYMNYRHRNCHLVMITWRWRIVAMATWLVFTGDLSL